MLILTRKEGEVITIGDRIEVQIMDIKNGVVRVGVHAPDDVMVYREEIYKQIQDAADPSALAEEGNNDIQS